MLLQLAIVLSGAVTSSAFTVSQTTIRGTSPIILRATTASDAISTLDQSQATSTNTIASSIPDLQPKPDFTWTSSGTTVDIGGNSATLDARDAPGPANIAWFSAVCVPSRLSSLTIFNGPLTDCPHLVSRCAVVGGEDGDDQQLRFTQDFRPRAYGAYEMKREDGSYPGPDELGRKSFEYSGARTGFDAFGNDELRSFLSTTADSFEGAVDYDPDPTELDLLTRGPLYMCKTMPLTDGNVAAVVAARGASVNYWLSWVQDDSNQHRPGAPVNTQYVYDSKYKQNAFGSLFDEYARIFGAEEGKTLAMGESGPLDEGYVGGGS